MKKKNVAGHVQRVRRSSEKAIKKQCTRRAHKYNFEWSEWEKQEKRDEFTCGIYLRNNLDTAFLKEIGFHMQIFHIQHVRMLLEDILCVQHFRIEILLRQMGDLLVAAWCRQTQSNVEDTLRKREMRNNISLNCWSDGMRSAMRVKSTYGCIQ